jgi:hypothetical protein
VTFPWVPTGDRQFANFGVEGDEMNSKLKPALIAASFLLFTGGGAQTACANARPSRTAQTQNNSTSGKSDKIAKAAADDCSLLTPAMIEKVTGQPFIATERKKAMPMYGGAWGWSCTYHGQNAGGGHVDFSVYAEASAAKAKQDFDTLSIGADYSKGKPSIGDSAYWFGNDKEEPYLYVLKGKVRFSIGISTGTKANEKQLKQTQDLAAAVAART